MPSDSLVQRAAHVASCLSANALTTDQDDAFPHAEFDWLREAGLLAAPIPNAYGGASLGTSECSTDTLLQILWHIGYGNAVYVVSTSEERLHSIVFAVAVPPMLMKMPGNPDGPLDATKAASMPLNTEDFYDQFTTEFFSLYGDGELVVTEEQRQEAIALCQQASKIAALEAIRAPQAAGY